MKLGIPHVVILGAGASRAAFPYGERNGIVPPLMKDFVRTVGLEDLLNSKKISFQDQNFEDVYDQLHIEYEGSSFLEELKERIHLFFSKLRLPDELTIYDRLVLSLREKDIIATFNWDPFLVLSYKRNCHIAALPKIAFLHGNVAIGVCLKDKVSGYSWDVCSRCGDKLTPTNLFYPIKKKNYKEDPFIDNEWTLLENDLVNAYFFTIFGYSAPNTDVEAISLMDKIYAKNSRRDIAEIEIINIRPTDELLTIWDEFIVRSHYGIINDY